jgi:hypothetical protein
MTSRVRSCLDRRRRVITQCFRGVTDCAKKRETKLVNEVRPLKYIRNQERIAHAARNKPKLRKTVSSGNISVLYARGV